LHAPGPERVERTGHPSPHVRPETLPRLLGCTELERGQLVIDEPGTRDALVAQFATVEDEREQVVPRAVWRHPIHAEKRTHPDIEAEFLLELPLYSQVRRFVGLGHAARCVQIRLVLRIDEQYPSGAVTQDHVSADAFARLLGVAFGQMCLPRLGVTLVPGGVRAHRLSPNPMGWPCLSFASHLRSLGVSSWPALPVSVI